MPNSIDNYHLGTPCGWFFRFLVIKIHLLSISQILFNLFIIFLQIYTCTKIYIYTQTCRRYFVTLKKVR